MPKKENIYKRKDGRCNCRRCKTHSCAASQKSSSVFKTVHMLFKSIFNSAIDSNIIDSSPCERISGKGGKPPKEREALTDAQASSLLKAIEGLPPYVFVMIGLYAGLRREEILGLK